MLVVASFKQTRPDQARTGGDRGAGVRADAARVLDYPYSVGDRICKMIGDELGITIDKALETNPDLKKAYDGEEDVHQVVDAAKSILAVTTRREEVWVFSPPSGWCLVIRGRALLMEPA